MCLDFPGRIVARTGDSVIVESDGRRRRASTLLYPDVTVGNWVYVAAGTVIEVLDDASANQITQEIAIARGVAP
jgi:hydrogenase assembly chaperone HypC/HupF